MRIWVDVETQLSEVVRSKLAESSFSEQNDMVPGPSRHFPSRLVSIKGRCAVGHWQRGTFLNLAYPGPSIVDFVYQPFNVLPQPLILLPFNNEEMVS